MIAKVAAGITALFQCAIALIEMAFWMRPKVHYSPTIRRGRGPEGRADCTKRWPL